MATREVIIKNAKKYLGKPYVWGGESEAEGGYDCSGYLYNVLKDSGYKVSRTTASGYSKLGKEVSYVNANAGDLLFFGKARITHVAIYAGNGKMYESIGGRANTKTNKGKGVTLSDVTRRSDLKSVRTIADVPICKTYYPSYDRTSRVSSIVVALQLVGEADTSFAHRKQIAKANGIANYTGTASQNTQLLKLLSEGKLVKV